MGAMTEGKTSWRKTILGLVLCAACQRGDFSSFKPGFKVDPNSQSVDFGRVLENTSRDLYNSMVEGF